MLLRFCVAALRYIISLAAIRGGGGGGGGGGGVSPILTNTNDSFVVFIYVRSTPNQGLLTLHGLETRVEITYKILSPSSFRLVPRPSDKT